MHYSLHNKSNFSILSFRAFFMHFESIFPLSHNPRATKFRPLLFFLVKTNACGAVRRRRRKIFEIWSIFLQIFRFVFTVVRGGESPLSANGTEAPWQKIFCYQFVNFKICEIFNEILKNVSTSELAQPLMFSLWKILRREQKSNQSYKFARRMFAAKIQFLSYYPYADQLF